MKTRVECRCGGSVRVVRGGETDKMLACNKCGDYLYYVGGIRCVGSGNGIPDMGRKRWEELCGPATLNDVAKKKIAEWEERFGK